MNQHLSIKHTNAAGAESPVFWHKTIDHQLVRFEKIVHRRGQMASSCKTVIRPTCSLISAINDVILSVM